MTPSRYVGASFDRDRSGEPHKLLCDPTARRPRNYGIWDASRTKRTSTRDAPVIGVSRLKIELIEKKPLQSSQNCIMLLGLSAVGAEII